VFTSPIYNDIKQLQSQVVSYNQALDNSKALENERDKLTAKFNAITPDNLAKLQKLLPDSIDNIRLILEMGQVAMPYGMVLKNVQYNTKDATSSVTTQVQGGGTALQASSKDYGAWDLSFSIAGTYNNFINFTKNLESNLRIVDISSIDFSSDSSSTNKNSAVSDSYQYNFKIKTYWLKN
jgi:Tfp pilus assembly protein PilO